MLIFYRFEFDYLQYFGSYLIKIFDGYEYFVYFGGFEGLFDF